MKLFALLCLVASAFCCLEKREYAVDITKGIRQEYYFSDYTNYTSFPDEQKANVTKYLSEARGLARQDLCMQLNSILSGRGSQSQTHTSRATAAPYPYVRRRTDSPSQMASYRQRSIFRSLLCRPGSVVLLGVRYGGRPRRLRYAGFGRGGREYNNSRNREVRVLWKRYQVRDNQS